MDRDFIFVHADGIERLIFVDTIVSVIGFETHTEIGCVNGMEYCVDETYGEVLEKISI